MKVKELKKGMLLLPRKGLVFKLYASDRGSPHKSMPPTSPSTPAAYAWLTTMKRPVWKPVHVPFEIFDKPAIYLGMAPKTHTHEGSYEYRHRVYLAGHGEFRVDSTAWQKIDQLIE